MEAEIESALNLALREPIWAFWAWEILSSQRLSCFCPHKLSILPLALGAIWGYSGFLPVLLFFTSCVLGAVCPCRSYMWLTNPPFFSICSLHSLCKHFLLLHSFQWKKHLLSSPFLKWHKTLLAVCFEISNMPVLANTNSFQPSRCFMRDTSSWSRWLCRALPTAQFCFMMHFVELAALTAQVVSLSLTTANCPQHVTSNALALCSLFSLPHTKEV